jgi:hypothetical protein
LGRLETLGGAQGKHARSIGFDDGVDIDVVPKGDATEYNVSGYREHFAIYLYLSDTNYSKSDFADDALDHPGR